MSEIIGWVGIKNGRTVSGWVADDGQLDAVLTVTVTAGQWSSKPLKANEYRHHLRLRKFGTARYGFSVDVPSDVVLPQGQSVTATVHGHSGVRFTTRVTEENRHQGKTVSAQQSLQIIVDGGLPARKDVSSLDDLAPFAEKVLSSPRLANLLRDAGRSQARLGNHVSALRLLGAAMQLKPNDHECIFQYAVAASRENKNDIALDHFRWLYLENWRASRVLSEYAQALRREIERSGHDPDPDIQAKLIELVEVRLSLADENEGILPASIAITLKRLGMTDLALRAIEHTITIRPDRIDAHLAKARIMIESKRVDEGLKIARAIIERWPDNESANHMLRTFRHMVGMNSEDVGIAAFQAWNNESFQVATQGEREYSIEGAIEKVEKFLRSNCLDWIVFDKSGKPVNFEEVRGCIETTSQAGCIRLNKDLCIWKVTALLDLFECDIVRKPTIVSDLERVERSYIRPAPPIAAGRAILLSRFGAIRFGGAEHFLHSASMHYARLGYRPLLLGDIEKMSHGEVADIEPELSHDFCAMDPVSLRRIFLAEDVSLVHAISGMGGLVASALGDMNVPFIYGVHYFREVLGGEGGEIYFQADGTAIPRSDFGYLLSRASTVYANSTYTQDLIERMHGVRCPVIFSVPEERPS